LFLAAFFCSGFAGLIYQLSWTRLLTLQMGHTTAAASTVVAAFMGGLALGGALGGRVALSWTLRRCLYAYLSLECVVALFALVLPTTLGVFTPVLAWAYRDGTSGTIFPAVRLLICLVLVLMP